MQTVPARIKEWPIIKTCFILLTTLLKIISILFIWCKKKKTKKQKQYELNDGWKVYCCGSWN